MTMVNKQTTKSNGVTIQINMGKASDKTPGKGKVKGALWKKSNAKEIKIIEDIDSECNDLPGTNHTRRGTLGGQHIQVPTASPLMGRKESLTVPGILPGSSDNKDDTFRARTDSVSLGRESSKLSLESRRSLDIRLQHAAVQLHPVEEKPKSLWSPDESWIRSAIPFLPLGVAVVCLLMNIVLPGSGTIVSGFSIFCCGKPRVPAKKDEDVIVTLCVNVWVGVAQLFTVSFLLVGWFWSLAWGIKMVILAAEHRQSQKTQRAKELQALALSAFGSNKQVKQVIT